MRRHMHVAGGRATYPVSDIWTLENAITTASTYPDVGRALRGELCPSD
jgi:hypothetical protein